MSRHIYSEMHSRSIVADGESWWTSDRHRCLSWVRIQDAIEGCFAGRKELGEVSVRPFDKAQQPVTLPSLVLQQILST